MENSNPAVVPTAEFHQLLLKQQKKLRQYALKLTRSTDQADDLVQQVCLKALENRHQFQAGSNLPGWLSTIMYNTQSSKWRRGSREVMGGDDYWKAIENVTPGLPAQAELRLDLMAVLHRLPPNQMKLLQAYLLEAKDYDDLAKALAVPIGTVKSRLSRMRQSLKNKLEHGSPSSSSARQPNEVHMAHPVSSTATPPAVADTIGRIATLANRHPKHFGDLILTALGSVNLSPKDLAETFQKKNLIPHDVKFLMPWIQAHTRPSWQSKHIEAMLVVFETTPSKFLETLRVKTGEPAQAATPEPVAEVSPSLRILLKHASEQAKSFGSLLLMRLVDKGHHDCDGLAKSFADKNLRPNTRAETFQWLRSECPVLWESGHVLAALEFLGDTPEEFLAYARERQQAKAAANAAPSPKPATPPTAPAPTAKPVVEKAAPAAVTAPVQVATPIPSDESPSFFALADLVEDHRVKFGEMIRHLVEEQDRAVQDLHTSMAKVGAIPSSVANIYNLLNGKSYWNEARMKAAANFLKMDAEALDARFTAWLAGETSTPTPKVEAPAAAVMAPAPKEEPTPMVEEPSAASEITTAPEPEPEEAEEIPVATPEPEMAQEDTPSAVQAAAVMAPAPERQPEPTTPAEAPVAVATAITETAPDKVPTTEVAVSPQANQLNDHFRPEEAGMLKLTQEQLEAMAKPDQMKLLLETIQQLQVSPSEVSAALWQLTIGHLAAMPGGPTRVQAIYGLLGKTL
jgi:RNA polymerase sigma-70 factor (ECF subfamily)